MKLNVSINIEFNNLQDAAQVIAALNGSGVAIEEITSNTENTQPIEAGAAAPVPKTRRSSAKAVEPVAGTAPAAVAAPVTAAPVATPAAPIAVVKLSEEEQADRLRRIRESLSKVSAAYDLNHAAAFLAEKFNVRRVGELTQAQDEEFHAACAAEAARKHNAAPGIMD